MRSREQPAMSWVVESPDSENPLEFTAVRPANWTSVQFRALDGSLQRVPPFDALDADLTKLAPLPGVVVRFAATLTCGPFGTATITCAIEGGLVKALDCRAGIECEQVDIWFQLPLSRWLARRIGRISTVEMLSPPADMLGEVHLAMLIAGWLDDTTLSALPLVTEYLRRILSLTESLDGAALSVPSEGVA